MDLLLDPDQVPPPRVARSRHRLQVRHGQGHQELPAAQGDVQPVALLQVTLDLLEMVFVKGDPGIATLYDKLLVADDLMPLGVMGISLCTWSLWGWFFLNILDCF
jgi:hypothetical protein